MLYEEVAFHFSVTETVLCHHRCELLISLVAGVHISGSSLWLYLVPFMLICY